MLVEDDSLNLYHLTLRGPSVTIKSKIGQFLGSKKSQELVLATSTTIEVWKPNSNSGKLEKLSQQLSLGIIQCIDTLRLPGTQQDFLVITSDSGKIVIAEYQQGRLQFVPIIQEPHSKNGLRRLTPGEYLDVDPNSHAIMISAIEKNKLVYKVRTNGEGSLELSSPLEAASKLVLTLKTCLLDTEFDNPMFAALEIDYSKYEADDSAYDPATSPVLLTFYELDQGLNHIIRRKASLPPGISLSSVTCLIPLPGFIGGLFVCCQSYIIYCHPEAGREMVLPLPVRKDTNGTIITTFVYHKLKKNNFFIMCQSTVGDLFKITVDFNEDTERLEKLYVKYFDTIPYSNHLCIFKSGFLFADVANSNKLFYQFEDLSEEADDTTIESLPEFDVDIKPKYFAPKGLENLALVDIIETLGPILDGALVESSSPGSSDVVKQLVTLSSPAHLKTLTHGIPTTTVVSEPSPEIIPTAVFTVKKLFEAINDDYLILSALAPARTLVLVIGEEIELCEDSELVTNQSTIAVQQVGRSSIVQVHTYGIRHIKHTETTKKTTDWDTPGGISIVQASTNNNQIIIGLSNREIRYFEVDALDDQLQEYGDSMEITSGSILALALAPTKANFAVVGNSDETVQVVSLQQHNMFEVLTLQALSSASTSVVVLPYKSSLYVHIGMDNGVYVRALVDEITGKLSDTRIQYLGTKPVVLSTVALPQLNQNGILAISSRPWLGYNAKETFKVTPLINIPITTGASFYSEDLGGDGIVGIADGNLTIFTIGSDTGDETAAFNVNNDITIASLKLRYTPKRMVVDHVKGCNYITVIESDYGIKSPYDLDNQVNNLNSQVDIPVDEDYYEAFGYQPSAHSWASCVQVVDFSTNTVIQSIELTDNHSAVCLCKVQFDSCLYIVVGATQNFTFLPNTSTKNFLYTFEISTSPYNLKLVHKTSVDARPTAITSFNGKLLVASQNNVRLYDLGQKQLLRKSSTTISYLNSLVRVHDQGHGIVVVGDSTNSVTFLKFDPLNNQFIPVSDDIMQRQVTSIQSLDETTVMGGDKFGNLFVSRIPKAMSQRLNNDMVLKYQEGYLNGSGSRLQNLCEFFLHDIPTCLIKGTFNDGGGVESVIYTGIQGTIGLLMPILTKQEIELLRKLEHSIRKHYDYSFEEGQKEGPFNLLGKDHLKFRSYYNPLKNVVDGDLLERFYEFAATVKIKVAKEVDRTPKEIEKKLSDLRNRSAF